MTSSSRWGSSPAPTATGLFEPGSGLRDEQRTLAWYLAALDRRDRLIATCQEFFADVDALVVPPAMTAAFTHREPGTPLDVDGDAVGYGELGALPAFANLTGLPALVAPAGLTAGGLPVGVESVGPRWSEMRLLASARALEGSGVLPGFTPPPDS